MAELNEKQEGVEETSKSSSSNKKRPYRGKGRKGGKGAPTGGESRGGGNPSRTETTYPEQRISGGRLNLDSLTSNDINWLNRSVTYEGATSIQWIYRAGLWYDKPVSTAVMIPKAYDPASNSNGLTISEDYLGKSLPFGATYKWYPILGTSNGSSSPFNRCFNSMYIDVQQKTKYNLPFQQMDLAAVTGALDSVSYLIAYAKKVMNLDYFNQENYAYPYAFENMFGVQSSTYVGKFTKCSDELNVLIGNFNALKVPNYIDVFSRHYSTAYNLYKDSDSQFAQLINFRPCGYYQYQHRPDENASLVWKDLSWENKPMAWETLMDIIRTNLSVLRNDSGVSSVLAVLQKAYSETQLLTIDVVSETPTVPILDRNTNWQIKNAIMTGVAPKEGTLNVVQNVANNYAICEPTFVVEATNDEALGLRMIPMEKAYLRYNSSYDNVSDLKEFAMEAARYMVLTSQSKGELFVRGAVPNLGTDFIKDCEVHFVSVNGTYKSFTYGTFMDTDDTQFHNKIAAISAFTVHPYIYFVTPSAPNPQGKVHWETVGSLGEIDRYTVLDSTMLSALNQAALESIYLVNVKPTGVGI